MSAKLKDTEIWTGEFMDESYRYWFDARLLGRNLCWAAGGIYRHFACVVPHIPSFISSVTNVEATVASQSNSHQVILRGASRLEFGMIFGYSWCNFEWCINCRLYFEAWPPFCSPNPRVSLVVSVNGSPLTQQSHSYSLIRVTLRMPTLDSPREAKVWLK